jgi:hypothetical protein
LKDKKPKIPPLVERVCCWRVGTGMHFYISCSLWWSPNLLTPDERSAMWITRDKMCLKSFSRLEVNIIQFSTLSCVYWYKIFVKIIGISMLLESLNFEVLIESGVVCRLFVQLSEKCDSIKWLIFCYKPTKLEYWHLYYWSLMRSACFDMFSDPLCGFKSVQKWFGKVSIKRP